MASSKKKRAAAAAAASSIQTSTAAPASASARRSARLAGTAVNAHRKAQRRFKAGQNITADMWAAPVPPGLVGRLDAPKVKSKYKSYFEFAENTEKKKKLEFQVGSSVWVRPLIIDI